MFFFCMRQHCREKVGRVCISIRCVLAGGYSFSPFLFLFFCDCYGGKHREFRGGMFLFNTASTQTFDCIRGRSSPEIAIPKSRDTAEYICSPLFMCLTAYLLSGGSPVDHPLTSANPGKELVGSYHIFIQNRLCVIISLNTKYCIILRISP